MEFLTTPYVLIPLCVVAWALLKRHNDVRAHREWLAYQEQMKKTAIVSRRVLTDNEKEFFERLKVALPEFEVIAQVAMSALLDVALPEQHPQYWEMRKMFSQKTVDYVICKKDSMDVITVVELDDKSHDAKQHKDAARDKMLADAGVRTVRWDSRAKPSRQAIRQEILSLA